MPPGKLESSVSPRSSLIKALVEWPSVMLVGLISQGRSSPARAGAGAAPRSLPGCAGMLLPG